MTFRFSPAASRRYVREDLAAATAAYDSLASALCKEPHTTLQWVESLMAYNAAGVTTVTPGGAVTADDCFGAHGNPRAGASKVLAKFLEFVKLEKESSAIVPTYMPNLFGNKSPAAEAAAWVDQQCALLGVESLEHATVCWWDETVPGVGETIKALKATEKVGKVSLGMATKASLVAAHVAGETPATAVVDAMTVFTSAGAALLDECKVRGHASRRVHSSRITSDSLSLSLSLSRVTLRAMNPPRRDRRTGRC